jgi:hypothetical protein
VRSVGGCGVGKELAVMFAEGMRGGFGKLHRAARTWFVRPSINAAIFPTANTPGGGFVADSSRVCRSADLESDAFQKWRTRLGEPLRYNRKLWEWCLIPAVLDAKGLLREGVRGLGFAVGQEPLAALFGAHGCRVTATDLASQDPRAKAWKNTGQHADHRAVLNSAGICPEPLFQELVSFRSVDMNDIPSDLVRAEYDFTWSTCSFEHCGTLDQGLAFVRRQMDCLRPGGIAVHTTELNLSSNTTTIASGPTVIYRRRDIERLVAALAADGHVVAPLDFNLGKQPLDRHVDQLPYDFDRHMRLALYGYAVTSIGLVVTKRA